MKNNIRTSAERVLQALERSKFLASSQTWKNLEPAKPDFGPLVRNILLTVRLYIYSGFYFLVDNADEQQTKVI